MLFVMITTGKKASIRGQILPVLIALLILGSVAFVYAVDVDGDIADGEYQGSLSLAGGDFLLYWEAAEKTAHFGIRAQTQGWVCLGIEPTRVMAEADMIFGWVDAGGTAGALDCYSTGLFGPHPPDEELGGQQHLLAFAGREQGGVTTFEFSRVLETGDTYDKPLSREGKYKIIWATGVSDGYLDPHNRRGSAVILLTGDPAAKGRSAERVDLYGLLYRVHGALMSTAFVLLFVGMFFPRYLKKKKWWLKTHRRIGISGAAIGVVGIGIAVYMISQTTGVHLRVPHSWIGILTVILIIFTSFLGHFMLKIRKAPARAKKARAVHRWIGRVTLLFMAATIVLGLLQAGIL
jgi:cytochrome b561